MKSILDLIARPSFGRFHPTSTQDFFALRLAQKLDDADCAAHYAALAATYSQDCLLVAYRRASRAGNLSADRARRFHLELRGVGQSGMETPSDKLLAVKVERRSIAVALFRGTRLADSQVHHLPDLPDKAVSSATGFLNWILETFSVESATLEGMSNGHEIRRALLQRAVSAILCGSSLPIWEVGKQQLLDAFGYPPLRSRKELRQVTSSVLWPMIDGGKGIDHKLDAAALGLYVQTERLFNDIN